MDKNLENGMKFTSNFFQKTLFLLLYFNSRLLSENYWSFDPPRNKSKTYNLLWFWII